ncbi:MAG TPA: bacterioferritin [Candidatus Acidoferrum sp.]|nr:bacterioferritin [Candidatus Acidoferrum sp.]
MSARCKPVRLPCPREIIFTLYKIPTFQHLFPMKGNPAVLEQLNKALREELTAINQYFLHAEMCENWGYERLSKYIKMQSIGEMKHAESIMERILFLDGIPDMKPLELTIGKSVRDMIQSDLDLEINATKMYNDAIRVAVENKDNGSRDLFQILLDDEEDHVDWLEAQMHQITELGYERYLSMQMGEQKEEK